MLGRGGRRGRPAHPDVLTPAEWRVLEHVREGRTNAEIAVRLGISPDGVKFHVSNMLAKLNLAGRAELAKWEGVEGQSVPNSRSWVGPLFAKLPGTAAAKIAAGVAGIVIVGGGLAAGVALLGGGDDADSIPDVHATLTVRTLEIEMASSIDAGSPKSPALQRNTTHVWFEADKSSRVELHPDGQPTPVNIVVATDQGVFSWSPTSDGAAVPSVEQLPLAPEIFIPLGVTVGAPPELKSAVAGLARGGDARLDGVETVAGRPAYRVQIAPGPCAPPLPTADGNQTYWLDEDTFVVLKEQITARSDGRVVISQEATRIVYNQALAPSLFSPPAGVTITPAKTTPVALNPSAADTCHPRGVGAASPTVSVGQGTIQRVTEATASAVATVQSR